MASVVAAPLRAVRHYRSLHDLEWLHGLWQRAMPARWSLLSQALHNVLSNAAFNLVAEQAGTPVGFCAVGYKEGGPAGILIVLVEPELQRRGIGSALLEEVEQTLRTRGILQMQLGHGNDSNYFWPGAPADTHTGNFFSARGWKKDDSNYDLVQDLSHYTTPLWISSRLAAADVTLDLAEPHLRDPMVAFEQQWFPLWADFYVNATVDSEARDVIVAQDVDGAIVGSVLLRVAGSARWSVDSGVRHGTINVLGVAEDQRGKGVGLALAGRAMEILKERGCVKCYVQWTGLVDWYGKLGTKVWAEYHMGSKKLV